MLLRISVLLGSGLAAGLTLTLLLRRAAENAVAMRYGHDGLVIAGLVVLLAAIGFVAGILPTYRAASIDPVRTLRTE